MRPKYVRRQDLYSGDGGGEGQELGVWIRAGVVISRLFEGKGAVCALCRKCRRTKKGKVGVGGRV